MDGQISYDEFLIAVRGPMTERRRKEVSDIFKKMDKNNSGFITIVDLQRNYDASAHPGVKSRQRRLDDVSEELIDGIDSYYHIKGFNDGSISQEEFLEFYSFIGASIPQDSDFSELLRGVWSGAGKGLQPIGQQSSQRSQGQASQYSSQHGSRPQSRQYSQQGDFDGESNYGSNQGFGQRPATRQRDDNFGAYGSQPRVQGDHFQKKQAAYQEQATPQSRGGRSGYGDQGRDFGADQKRDRDQDRGLASPSSAALAIINKLRTQLTKRGPKTFIGLKRQLKIMDDNNDGCVNYPEFVKCLRDFGLSLNEAELKDLFAHIDKSNSKKVRIEDFSREYVGEMNEGRRELVNQVFNKIDTNSDGMVTLNEVKMNFTARGHPDLKLGGRSQDEILAEFFNTLDTFLMTRAGKKDQRISRQEFESFFNYQSVCITEDTTFEQFVRNCFRLPLNQTAIPASKTHLNIHHQEHQPGERGATSGNYQVKAPYGVSNSERNKYESSSQAYKSPVQPTGKLANVAAGVTSWPGTNFSDPKLLNMEEKFQSIISNLKETLVSRGIRGILGLGRLFRIMDTDNSQTLNFYEFSKALNDARLHFSEDDIKIVFNFFDREKDGHLYYPEFLSAVRGFMPEYRQQIVERAFDTIADEKGGSQITLEDIRLRFNPEYHPDVEAGRKSIEQATNEFLEAFESHHMFYTKDISMKNKIVSKKEFLEFFDNLSAVTPNDLNFEKSASKVWNRPIKKIGVDRRRKY